MHYDAVGYAYMTNRIPMTRSDVVSPNEKNQQGESAGDLSSLSEEIRQEVEQTQVELKEIKLMLEQSQGEVEKLAQRNATINNHLQQIQSKIKEIPTSELKTAYDAALDAQQRLVVMRGQLEKLQSEHNHLDKFLTTMRKVQRLLKAGGPVSSSNNETGSYVTAAMMIQAQETERQHLSRQMHDGPAQTLSNFIMQTEIAMRLFDVDPEKAREELSNLKLAASSTFQQIREFIYNLRPMMLDDLGLVPTMKRYIEAFREKSKINAEITVTGAERRLEPFLEVMIFRTMQELLNNASAHSEASQVTVQLEMGSENIRLVVEDNGQGFDPEDLDTTGLGINLIRERTEMLGGTFEIQSASGEGAKFILSLPASKAAAGV
jgi:two-component system sensor histidine kinase DegS